MRDKVNRGFDHGYEVLLETIIFSFFFCSKKKSEERVFKELNHDKRIINWTTRRSTTRSYFVSRS